MKALLLCVLLQLIGFSYQAVRNCSCVAFRLDDIQDYYTVAQQIRIMQVFQEENVPLTLGIIGSFFGEDNMIVNSVQNAMEAAQTSTCFEVEIANHGWQHLAFSQFNISEQQRRMTLTQQKCQQLLGVTPRTFMPPYNDINADTKVAAQTVGFKYLSSEVDQDPPPYEYNDGLSFYRLPIQPATGITVGTPEYYAPVDAKTVFQEIKNQLRLYGFSVVMMHPYEFGDWLGTDYSTEVNETTIESLRTVIRDVKQAGLKLVTIASIPSFFNASTPYRCAPTTTGVITTAPITTAPITTAPITTAPITTAPLTTGVITTAAITTGRITTGPLTTGLITTAPITTAPITTQAMNPGIEDDVSCARSIRPFSFFGF